MNPFSRAYTPTSNRRLNELVGFLLFVAAILLFLALVSYSPADPSLNTAGPPPGSHPARNWVGILGAYGSDLMLQAAGIAAFLVPVMLAFLGARWFRSRTVGSPGAKFAGALMLLVFAPGMLGLLPGHLRWRHAIPIEGLLGRIVGDALIHWFNLAGAYIVCAAVLAIGLYLSTTFSFGTLQTWAQTRFTFVFAALERFKDWRMARAKARALRELEKRRAQRPVVGAQETQSASPMPSKPLPASLPAAKSGIERMAE
ncbi:MAG TPA: DNA translocase FtsK 4TM domain-containing protein, partial [Terriglobales bacterium]|nr:DNA translocase FtsK 4TM domain-containing protein [Terriglobales bacterium]